MGFLDQLRETGATIAVTTHFDGLKTYGYLHPDVQNVAVEFDEKTLEPKYQLAYGSSGLSNAFLIAEKLGSQPRFSRGQSTITTEAGRKLLEPSSRWRS